MDPAPQPRYDPGYPPPPPPTPAPLAPGPRGSAGGGVALGVVALALGVVALLVSWVPWVNLLGLLLALGGLGVGVLAAVRRRGAARWMGVGGAAASVLALAVVLVLLAVSAVGFFRDRASATQAPPAASEPPSTPDPSTPDPSTPDPGPTPSGTGSDRAVVSVDRDEEMDLAGSTGVIDQLGASATWGEGADPLVDPPAAASVEYRLVLTGAGRSPTPEEADAVEVSFADGDGALLAPGGCETEPPVPGSVPQDSLVVRGCVALPVDFDGSVAMRILTPSVAGSPVHLLVGDVSIDDLRA